MNRKEKQILAEIKRDCLRLKRRGDLTQFGEGQLCLIYLLEAAEGKIILYGQICFVRAKP